MRCAQAAKFCYSWIYLHPQSSSPWCVDCPFISRASPASGSVGQRQGQVPSHLCPSQLHSWLQRPLWQRVHRAELSAPPSLGCSLKMGPLLLPSDWELPGGRSPVTPIRLKSVESHGSGFCQIRSSLKRRAASPPSDQGFPDHRDSFSPSLKDKEIRQTVPSVGRRGGCVSLGSALLPPSHG